MFNKTLASIMDQIIARAVEQNPHASELLKAFGPIIIRQRQLSSSVNLTKLDYSSIDKDKLKNGVPVSHHFNLFSPEDSLKEITLSIAEAVKEGFSKLTEDIDRILGFIKEDKIQPITFFTAAAVKENKGTGEWSERLKISPSNTSFLMNLVSRVILERRAKDITAKLGEFDWEKGYCPICGSFPSIALIEEEGGKRFLHCSSCGHDWYFTRVVCPYCENEAASGMDYFYIENKTQESAFVCDKCKKYLITIYRAGKLFARDMDVSSISLIHLDMLMQDKGYTPMTSCSWNNFS